MATEHEIKHGVSEITVEQAKAVHKELPPGGRWVTMRGHHVYIKGDQVIAGSFGDIKSGKVKKGTKGHISNWQIQHDTKKQIEEREKSEKANAKKNGRAGSGDGADAGKSGKVRKPAEKPVKPKLPGASPKGMKVIDHLTTKWQRAMHDHFGKLVDEQVKREGTNVPINAKTLGELQTNSVLRENKPVYDAKQIAAIVKEHKAGATHSKTAGIPMQQIQQMLNSRREDGLDSLLTKNDKELRSQYRYRPKEFTKAVEQEAARKKEALLQTMAKTAGKIKDASNLTLGDDGEINGHIVAEDGKTYSVASFGAGGHTVQKYHVRLKVTPLKAAAAKKETTAKPAAKKEPTAKPAAKKEPTAKPAAKKAEPKKPAAKGKKEVKHVVEEPQTKPRTRKAAAKPAAEPEQPKKPAGRKAAAKPAAEPEQPKKPAGRKAAAKPAAAPEPAKPAARKRTGSKTAGPDTGTVAGNAKKPAEPKKAAAKPKASVAEKKPAAAKNKASEVKDIRTEAQKNRTLAYDVGDKVGGAKKDTYQRKFTEKPNLANLRDLEKESPALAKKLVTKKNLLPPTDFEAEYKRGTDINTACLKHMIMARIAPQPTEDSAEAREAYVQGINELHRILAPVKTWDNVKDVVNELSNLAHAGKRGLDAEQKIDRFKNSPGAYTYFNEELHNEYAEKGKAARKQIDFAALGPKLESFFTSYDSRKRTVSTIAGQNLTWEKFMNPEASEGDGPAKGRPQTKGRSRSTWERLAVSEHQRTGGRETTVKKPEDMVKQFGMKGVEFGHYVDDSSGLYHLKRAAEAFHDLADVLGIDDKDISLNGKLSMAFGARGKGGAAAHYESENRVINMTKNGGAGSLAHEWGHALDNILYAYSHDHKREGGFGSTGMDTLGDRDPHLKNAYETLMEAITQPTGNSGGTQTISLDSKQASSYLPSLSRDVQDGMSPQDAYVKYANNFRERKEREVASIKANGYRTPDEKKKRIAKSEREYAKNMRVLPSLVAYAMKQKTGEHYTGSIEVPTGKSEYLTRMEQMDGGGKPYFAQPEEMFARAFESYVEDKLNAKKRMNNYLVWNTKTKRGEEAPFPVGVEREAINDAMDDLIQLISTGGTLRKALRSEELHKSLDRLFRPLFDRMFANNLKAEERKQLGQESIAHFMQTGEYLQPNDYVARLAALRQRRDPDGIEVGSADTERSAYTIDHETDPSEVIYIPVNRLKMVYQTDDATDWDKVRSNMERMKAGEGLKPVEIGYDYDVHDGHHRWIGSKGLDYTHVPCIVKGKDEADRQDAIARYRELWKSFSDTRRPVAASGDWEGCTQFYLDGIQEGKTPEQAWSDVVDRFDLDAGEQQTFRSVLSYDLQRLQKSWNEAEHPRDADGRFGTGGGAPVTLYHGTALVSAEAILKKGFKAQWSGKGDMGKCAYFKSPEWDHKESDNFGTTERLVNDFADNGAEKKKSQPAVIKAMIPREHLLDCSKGRPAELQALIDATRYMNRPDGIPQWGKKDSPYELYAKKHGIKAIIDKLDTDWEDEGWQLGVYDPSIIQILDVGKQTEGFGDSLELRKSQAEAPYCLLHHEFDADGNLVLHVGTSEVK